MTTFIISVQIMFVTKYQRGEIKKTRLLRVFDGGGGAGIKWLRGGCFLFGDFGVDGVDVGNVTQAGTLATHAAGDDDVAFAFH